MFNKNLLYLQKYFNDFILDFEKKIDSCASIKDKDKTAKKSKVKLITKKALEKG